MRRLLWIALAVAMASCGGDSEEEAPAARSTPEPTPTPTATQAPPERARSVRDCLKLWNADEAIGSTHQVSHTEFVAELARKGRTPVRVSYERRHCYVTARIGERRIAWFVAQRGYAPFSTPERRNLEASEYVPWNGRALRDGRIRLRR
jgi:hypothetical protein